MSDEAPESPQITAMRKRFAESLWLDANGLEQGLEKFESSKPGAALIDELRQTAHRLVGRLGLFGFTQPCLEAERFGDAMVPSEPDTDRVLRTGRGLIRTLRSLQG